MKNITFRAKDFDYRPAFVFDDVTGLNISEFDIRETAVKKQIILKSVNEVQADEKISAKILEIK